MPNRVKYFKDYYEAHKNDYSQRYWTNLKRLMEAVREQKAKECRTCKARVYSILLNRRQECRNCEWIRKRNDKGWELVWPIKAKKVRDEYNPYGGLGD